jgi:hypothetical protein
MRPERDLEGPAQCRRNSPLVWQRVCTRLRLSALADVMIAIAPGSACGCRLALDRRHRHLRLHVSGVTGQASGWQHPELAAGVTGS